ncbi:ligase-associated DNA damage response DEXH box helicase [Gluconacetobacter sacchari]|uniref:Ligase-associated DNA damage response DEXH box helicase n=2 Tax=Gluconacetobacter sacchari TaxID=92759 RepID=A0A7W4IGJ6_9PROT|nr:ligase-associated DNA damage response DEXH box helicase [Gluconacetobacter sacchari]MBB2162317.1 ligase-associated DNA damage response DEXH box helicase [Gluconacetobacter sacchari]
MTEPLPVAFRTWFAARGWHPYPHQLAMLDAARAGHSALLIAPTGGGKTLAGFLPSFVALADAPRAGLHTVYVAPLKALTANIADAMARLVGEARLGIRLDVRTGDTPSSRRRRQARMPPQVLLTTPESLSLLLSRPEATTLFAALRTLIIDEVHALAGTKRGDQLALCAERLATLAPGLRRVGLSATAAHPAALAAYVAGGAPGGARIVRAGEGMAPEIGLILPDGPMPWTGHMGLASAGAILRQIERAKVTIVFVNSRAQAELLFQALWKINDRNLPIGLHHGSLDPARRSRIEAAMAAAELRAVIATSSLDLGIDWGDVEQIIQVGAPREAARLAQRIGRSNHRMDRPSRAFLVPANRFEVLESVAAREAVLARDLDGEPPGPGTLDVLAQHMLLTACHGPFLPDRLFAEIGRAAPYAMLGRECFDAVLDFVETGGFALRAYDRHRRLHRDALGRMEVRTEAIARTARMNIGTIVETPRIRVRTRRGRDMGSIDEYFASTLVAGDTFFLGGEVVEFLTLRETTATVARSAARTPRVPVYGGSRLSMSRGLAGRVRDLIHDRARWDLLPPDVRDWLSAQARRSVLPQPDRLLVETFPRRKRWYLVAYGFEGRNAHQTLGLLATRILEETGAAPLGFVATDDALACWCMREPADIHALFSPRLLEGDMTEWLAESAVVRRAFREVAVISGLTERQVPGRSRTGRQMTASTDLLYDVLRRYDPDHVLLRATWQDAARGLTNFDRIRALVERVQGRIDHRRLDRGSPLAVPILLELGRNRIRNGEGEELLLREAEALVHEAGLS